ncbi:sorcin-like isoform X1 [Quercus lobata]|uniref:sorcin-like isoform X1 n=1 Tax=Quercus lobata TaxID=97700 RepID=UPI0012453DF9|nr:sorcin-like isoform X1 [Quercus lobata]
MENTAMLKDWFERVDSEKTGTITAPQLKSALSVGNLEFSLSVVQQMIRMYDFDRNGTMSFDEFVALNKFLLKVQQAFSDRERGRGYIVPDDVYEFARALIKRRMGDFGWMTSYLFVYFYSLLGIYSVHLIQQSKAG